METKFCKKCKTDKPVTEYYVRKTGKLIHDCKSCWSIFHKSEHGRALQNKYYATPKRKDIMLVGANKRRAVVLNAPGGHYSAAERKELFDLYCGLCVYCDAKATTVDHIVSLAKNHGSNAIENLVPACRSCNSSKGAKHLLTWLATRL